MKTIGIVAEFNPFHNGHKYLIEKAKEATKADNVIIISSGNFVQRGTPAFIDKSIRAKAAVQNGADVVFELPTVYSTASAELFARGAISFLDMLNCVDYLCFGCETENIKLLPKIACILNNEPDEYKLLLNTQIKKGHSFPKARMETLCNYCASNGIATELEVRELISSPNNILAVEYLKALKFLNSEIKPVAIKRLGSGYESTNLDNIYASATGIRNSILNNDEQSVNKHIPSNAIEQLYSKYILIDDFNAILSYKLATEDDYSVYYGINEELSNRINSLKDKFTDITSFISLLQSKNNTYSSISRAILHIILSIKNNDIDMYINNGYHKHARLMAFNSDTKILSLIKEKSNLSIISKLSSYYEQCTDNEKKMLDSSIRIDNIYKYIYQNKYNDYLTNEFQRQIYIK